MIAIQEIISETFLIGTLPYLHGGPVKDRVKQIKNI
jgi:hypothetical protein